VPQNSWNVGKLTCMRTQCVPGLLLSVWKGTRLRVYIYTVYMYIFCTSCVCHSVDDDYDEYGRSLEDDEPLSPSTAGTVL
jgi:hypothetical protein